MGLGKAKMGLGKAKVGLGKAEVGHHTGAHSSGESSAGICRILELAAAIREESREI